MKKGFKVKSFINLEDVVKGLLVKKVLGIAGAAAVEMTPRMYASLLMSEKTQNLWVHLMRSIKQGSARGVTKYSEALERELQETGSLEEPSP